MSDRLDERVADDALGLEPLDMDGHEITFTWYYRGGIDRLSATIDTTMLGVVEHLESGTPRMISNPEWSDWLAEDGHEQSITAAARERWLHRTEIVADRASTSGGR